MTASMMNKKKRKLRAPIVSLSDKQFLLKTPIANNETPKRANHSMSITTSSAGFPILSRQNLTYTPMTRKLLHKQQGFVCSKYASHLPAISLTRSSFPILVDENINIHIQNNINITNNVNNVNTVNNVNHININNANNASNKQMSNLKKININRRRRKKRKFAEMEADKAANPTYNTPNIPGSVRKKRRLTNSAKVSKPTFSNTKKKKNRKKPEMTSSAKKKVMKKVLNNEFNPSLSISFQSTSPSLSILHKNTNNKNKNKNSNEVSMVLDFNTPSKSVSHLTTPVNAKKIVKKRRLSATRGSDTMLSPVNGAGTNSNSNSSSSKTEMISRRRRKRHSLSSKANTIKKASKRPTKKLLKSTPKREISPFDAPIPPNVKKTYKRRKSIVGNRSMAKCRSKSTSLSTTDDCDKKNKKKSTNKMNINICPLITKLMDRGDRSQIAFIAYHCLSLISAKMQSNQQNIFRKFDSFLCLLSRAEIILKNDEQTRLQQINSFNNNSDDDKFDGLWDDEWKNIYKNKQRRGRKAKGRNGNAKLNENIIKKATKTMMGRKSNNKKRVRFCCYDMSTVSTPCFGDLDSIKHLQTICRLLVQSGSIILKLFRIKSDKSLTRKTIKMFIDQLNEYHTNNKSILKMDVTKYLIKQFEDGYNHKIAYPFCTKISNLLSSLIRFYLKTIWNASEFLDEKNKNKSMKIPKWYKQIGTFTVFGAENGDILQNNSNAEFIPYHAAELSINLETYYCLKDAIASNKNKTCQQLMDELGILDNPFVFFNEMKQVLMNANRSICGLPINTNKKQSEFDKYLQSKWKELKVCLHDIENTNSTNLYFYLPLLDFKQFLNSIQVIT